VASEAIFIIAKDVGVAYQLRSQMIHLQLDKNNTGDLAGNTGTSKFSPLTPQPIENSTRLVYDNCYMAAKQNAIAAHRIFVSRQ
jgi:hypothetical protein